VAPVFVRVGSKSKNQASFNGIISFETLCSTEEDSSREKMCVRKEDPDSIKPFDDMEIMTNELLSD
jgi:hypothetical protein